MPKFVLIVLALPPLLLSAAVAFAQTGNAQLTGTVTYHERVALPSDARIDVQLIDAAVADVASRTVAEVLINAEGRQVPVAFTLTYDPAQIVPAHRYSVRASIRSGDGMLLFSSTQAYPVLTNGAPAKANLILHTVGHGTHGVATAKKQAPKPDASEAAPTAIPEANVSKPTAPSPPEASAAKEPSAPEPTQTTPSDGNAVVPQSQPVLEVKAAPPSAVTSAAPSAEQGSSPSVPAAPGNEPVRSQGDATADEPTRATAEAQAAPPVPVMPQPSSAEPSAPTATQATSSTTQPEASNAGAAQPVAPEPAATPAPAEPQAPQAEAPLPEAPLPEAPSATKRGELAMAAPGSDEETVDGESTSRPERPLPNKAATPLADTQWKLVQLGSEEVVITPPQKPVTLAFSPEGRRIAGSAGCNTYLGTFTDENGGLHLNPSNMTMLYCADPAGSREKKFVAMLRSADAYRIDGDSLVLTREGKIVAKFKNNSPL